MKVTNRTTNAVIAFGTHVQYGYGEDTRIGPGEMKDVSGPYIGVMGDGDCHIHLTGEIVCQDSPDDEVGFQVLKGSPLCLQSGDTGITVRHYEDEPESYISEWRKTSACTPSTGVPS